MLSHGTMPPPGILAQDEPAPLEIINEAGTSPFVLVCEHAGRIIPRALGDMGLSEEDRARHIAWDIGARPVAEALSALLDAPLFMQRYSRLVCDCNRRPDVASFAPAVSEATTIPANVGLGDAERDARAAAIFWPFHDALTAFLDERQSRAMTTFLVSIHTFTPVFLGFARPWEIGVLFNRDPVFAPFIAEWMQRHTGHCVGVNQPYSVGDDTDYAIPVHGERRGLPCVEFEIRNDLIADAAAAERWAQLLQRSIEAGKSAVDAASR